MLNAGPPFTWPLACAKPVMERMGIRSFSLGLRGMPRKVDINELKIIQPPIGAEFLHQFFMASHVGDSAVFYEDDAVGAAHGRKPVSDYNYRASGHKVLQR